MSLDGVTQGDLLSIVLYGITLVPLEEELRDADPTLLSPFYVDDASFDRLVWQSAAQLRLLMDRRPDQDYFPELSKYLFITANPEEKEAEKRESKRASLNLNRVDGGRYLGSYLGPREELDERVWPKVEACSHGVCTLAKIANLYP